MQTIMKKSSLIKKSYGTFYVKNVQLSHFLNTDTNTSLQFEYFLEMIMIGPKKFLSSRYPAKYEVQYFSG
jgi:hypothetical protein